MKIVRCDCSHNVHIFPLSGNTVCLFCNNRLDENKAITDNIFKRKFSFLNEKLSEIDTHISLSEFSVASRLIDEILTITPGPEIGDLQKTGEIHWRKLLVGNECKNDFELLKKGKLLQEQPTFSNAKRYAAENEESVYTTIEEKKKRLFEYLIKELKEQEHNEKHKIGSEKTDEYQKELERLKKQAIENVACLEEIEKGIREQIIDYIAFVDEFNHFVNVIYIKIKAVGDTSVDNISIELKDSWLAELGTYLSLCNQEMNNFRQREHADEHYLEYSNLKEKQRTLVNYIKENISQIKDMGSKIDFLLKEIDDQVTKKFAAITLALRDGNYESAIEFITPSRFDEIIKRVLVMDQP